MKLITTFITAAACLMLCSTKVSAQHISVHAGVGMAAPYTFPVSSHPVKKALLGDWKYGLEYASFMPYTFRVTLKDGSQKVVNSAVFPEINGHRAYLSFTDKHLPKSDPKRTIKIYPSDTQYIDLLSDDSLSIMNGQPTDSCWLFAVIEGKVKAFSYLPETEGFARYSLIAFQVGDQPIQPWDPRAFENTLKTDDKAYRYFLKKEYYDAILKFDATH